MPAFTSFLNLYKPGGGSTGLITPDEVMDVDRINANSDLIDNWAKNVGDFTSSRQTNFYGLSSGMSGALTPAAKDGDTYRETDGDKKLWLRSGGNWITAENGLYLIRPTSVVGCQIDASGAAVISGSAQTWSFNNVFSSRFRKYRMEFYLKTAVNAAFTVRLRNAGADLATSIYGYLTMESNGSAFTTVAPVSQPAWPLNNVASPICWGSFDVTNPAFAGTDQTKTYNTDSNAINGPTSGKALRHGWASGQEANSFDGFSLLAGQNYAAPSWLKIYGLV